MGEKKEYKILFVCLGNICRSPSAEAVMKKLVKDAGLDNYIEVDSAGIMGYHEGERADQRMRAHASRRGYMLDSISRPVRTTDFYDFDLKASAGRGIITKLNGKNAHFSALLTNGDQIELRWQ